MVEMADPSCPYMLSSFKRWLDGYSASLRTVGR